MSGHLPCLEGTTLAGRLLRLPQDLPAPGLVLVIGFTHEARHDVGAWKRALTGRGVPFLSLPTAAEDTEPEAMAGVAQAMRVHVPERAWDQVVQVHRGGLALQQAFGWKFDVFAKLLRVTAAGEVVASHDDGPFTDEAFLTFLG